MTDKELLERVLEFLTSDGWGKWNYMDYQVYHDASELVELIKSQLEEKQ